MNTTELGRKAESAAAKHLQDKGYSIIECNWRTKWCEIDIIARKNSTVYFVEVKYRSNSWAGTGLDYITPAKLRQMARAAEGWTQQHNWAGDLSLCAAQVSGTAYLVTSFIIIV